MGGRFVPHSTAVDWVAQVVTVDDSGTILGLGVGVSGGRCAVEFRTDDAEVAQTVVPVAATDDLLCDEWGWRWPHLWRSGARCRVSPAANTN